jgi:endonuclease/exonuclease/phosphatase family metal-dependent hydrolase
MRKILLFLFFILPMITISQVVMSWNIRDLGKAKYERDTIIPAIANVMIESKADIIAVQEVVLNSYGDSCIIQLANILKYNYVISARTSGDAAERYAYIYRKDIKLDTSYLESRLADLITREPFVAHFTYNCRELVIRQVHLVPPSKNPAAEVRHLYYYKDGIICGDFNLTDLSDVYTPFYSYFKSPLLGQPTTLKMDGGISTNSYDHFLVDDNIKVNHQYVFDYKYVSRRSLSDHLPIIIIL